MKWQTDKPCVACGRVTENGNALHHILTRKAFSEFQNEPWNTLPLCFFCHEKIHRGMNKFVNENPRVKEWLVNNGWQYNDFNGWHR